jgi:hypothetical protein
MRTTLTCWCVALLVGAAACGGGPSTENTAAAPAAPAAREITVPAGTDLPLTLQTRVGSAVSRADDPVRASLRDPITIDGVEVVPAGATVLGHVTDAHPSGRVKGRASIGFRFDTLVIGGAHYEIRTALTDREAAATKKNDALSIGIPAAAGSVIGALAGGGKGALIGGAVGGGAGAAYVLSTPGREIVLPEGTAVRARLVDPVTVTVTDNAS